MTQQALADMAGCHVTMIRRYEANETQPTLEVIRNLARALSVSADALVFEAVSQLPPEEQSVVREVLESLIIKYQSRRWDSARAAAGKAER